MSCPVYLPDDKKLTVCREVSMVTQTELYRCEGCAEVIIERSRFVSVSQPHLLKSQVDDAMRDHVRRDEERMGL